MQLISQGTVDDFYDEFSTVHATWHQWESLTGIGRFNGENIGFLSFHAEVIYYYGQVLDRNGIARPTALSNLLPPYDNRIDGIQDPWNFSRSIEGWHNGVHRNVVSNGGIYPDQLFDPRENIKMRLFWGLHLFINLKFTQWMTNNNINYDDLEHTIV